MIKKKNICTVHVYYNNLNTLFSFFFSLLSLPRPINLNSEMKFSTELNQVQPQGTFMCYYCTIVEPEDQKCPVSGSAPRRPGARVSDSVSLLPNIAKCPSSPVYISPVYGRGHVCALFVLVLSGTVGEEQSNTGTIWHWVISIRPVSWLLSELSRGESTAPGQQSF